MIACPMPTTSWNKLKKVFKNDETAAYKVYLAHGGELPNIDSIDEIKSKLKFRSGNVSDLSKNMILKRLGQYNRTNNSSHRVVFEETSPTSYKGHLYVNYMPGYRNMSYDNRTLKTIEELDTDSTLEVIMSADDIITQDGNQFIIGGDVYPTYEDALNSIYSPEYQLSNSGVKSEDVKLNQLLSDILRPYGIKIEYIDNFKERFNVDGVAAADMLNKIIYVAKGKEDSTTLPEEAAHFIVEMLGENHPLYKSMYNIITQTSEYESVKKEYGSIYGNDENRIRKEAIGKVLSKYFLKRFENKEDLPIRVQSVFERVMTWFNNLFKKIDNSRLQESLDNIFGTVSNKVFEKSLKLNPDLLTSDKDVYFQVDKLKTVLRSNITRLEQEVKNLERKASKEDSEANIDEIKQAVTILKHRLDNEQIKDAARGFVVEYTLKAELSHLMDAVHEYEADLKAGEKPTIPGSTVVLEMQNAINLNGVIVERIIDAIKYEPELSDFYEEMKPYFDMVTLQLAEISKFVETIRLERGRMLLNEMMDPNSKYDPDDLLHSTIGDSGAITRLFVPMHAASDEVLKMIYKVVQDIYLETHRKALADGNRLKFLQMDMEKSGMKDMTIFHEKDKDGHNTGYLISEYKWGEYNQALDNTMNEISKLFGVPYNEIDFDTLKDNKDPETVAKMKKKNELWKLFMHKYMTQVDGKNVPNPPKNEQFSKLIKKGSATEKYYNELHRQHIMMKDLLPKHYRSDRFLYLVPQIRKDVMQTIKYSNNTLMKDLGSRFKESMVILGEDTNYGDQSGDVIVKNGSAIKTVPIYYTKPIQNKDDLTNDFTSAYTLFNEMALNFRSITDKLDDLSLIQDLIGRRKVYKTAEDKQREESGRYVGLAKSGYESETYKVLQNFFERTIFGKQQAEVKVKVKVAGKEREFNLTKILSQVVNYIRERNLFANIFTMGSGFIKGSIDSHLEEVIGEFTTPESKLWAEKEFGKNIADLLLSFNKRNKTNKVQAMFEHDEVMNDIKELFKRLDMTSRLSRVDREQIVFGPYEMIGMRVRGILSLSIYDNYRLVGDKFITKAQFERLGDKKPGKWEDYREKSLYNAYEVINGTFTPKAEYSKYITKELQNRVHGVIKQRTAVVDGTITKLDKTSVFNNVFGQALMLHRGWITSGAVERFKTGGINYVTGNYEEGYYRTVGKLIRKFFELSDHSIRSTTAMWNSLESYQKRGAMRAGADLGATILMGTIYMLAQGLADDDDEDEWWRQAMAYLATRAFLEQAAFMNPTEIVSILNSPSAATSMLDVSQSLFKSIFHDTEIEYGAYEGMSHKEKSAIQLSYLKNLWELQNPEAKNKYIKNQII